MTRSFVPSRCALVALLLLFFPIGHLSAKPMQEPTIEEGVRIARRVVVASYVDHRVPTAPIGYFGSVVARYRILETLKGEAASGDVDVDFAFSDGSACIEPMGPDGKPEFTFSPSMMPAPGSRWILLLLAPPQPVDRQDLARSVGRPAAPGQPAGRLSTAEIEALATSLESTATSTYRGPCGRLEATPENLARVTAELSQK